MRADGRYVLYWCRWNRRTESNHALTYAAQWANHLNLPLLYFESLTCDYPYANDRLHTFALQGMPETAESLQKLGIGCLFHIARRKHDSDREVKQVIAGAAGIVTDDCPLPCPEFHVSAYAVDSCCVVPMACIPDRSYAAYSIRPKIHKLLPRYLRTTTQTKVNHRFSGVLPAWHVSVGKDDIAGIVASCQIDHSVRAAPLQGGRRAAKRRLKTFLMNDLGRYAREKNDPCAHATSNMSPYLHWGYISSLEIALAVREYAEPKKLITDEFLEELIVRRELAFNFRRHSKGTNIADLPDWAQKTLQKHGNDPRDPVYSREQFENAATHDDLWNAAQKELAFRGIIHGYYRMYWGKKILEWSPTPQEALDTTLYLNDKYALDGQDPNSNANILWCFGLHDRPWSERPIFGMVRWMSREGMERKTDVKAYLREVRSLENGRRELDA